jgi:hypothetical protein
MQQSSLDAAGERIGQHVGNGLYFLLVTISVTPD